MITSRVRRVFQKLAANGVVELAREHADNPNDPQAADAMMNALAGADQDMMDKINSAFDNDQVDKVRKVIADFYRNVNVPSQTQRAVESGNAGHVIGILRQMLEDSLESLGASEQAPGFRDELARMRAQDNPEDALIEFADRMYASQIPRLAEAYLRTRTPDGMTKHEALQRQGVDPKDAAAILMRTLLFENTKRMMMADLDNSESFAMKDNDEHAYNTPPKNVRYAIERRKTGDQFDRQAPVGEASLRNYYLMYVRPVIDSFQDARGGVNTVGLTQWLNEEFYDTTDEPGEKITATTPDGQPLTALVSKNKFKLSVVQQWVQSAMQTQSLDAPAGEEGDMSRVDLIEDKLTDWDEEKQTKYYTENRPRIREDIKNYINEAVMETITTASDRWREPLRQAMLVKFGFGFDDEWVSSVEESKHKVPTKFYMTVIDPDIYKEIGRPKHKGWDKTRNPDWYPGAPDHIKKSIPDPAKAEKWRTYKKDWVQKGLQHKTTNNRPSSFPSIVKQDEYEVVDIPHRTGEEAKNSHFVNWHEYTPEQWKQDIEEAESNYDGQRWVDELVGKELKKRLKRRGLIAIQDIKPEKLLSAYSWKMDEPLLRAIGMGQITPSPQPSSVFPSQNTFPPVVKKMMASFWNKAKEDEDVWGYLALNREGKLASLDMERTIRLAVDSLMRKAG